MCSFEEKNIWYYSAIYQIEINDPLLLDRVCIVIFKKKSLPMIAIYQNQEIKTDDLYSC